jgi:hypothetical protein
VESYVGGENILTASLESRGETRQAGVSCVKLIENGGLFKHQLARRTTRIYNGSEMKPALET